MSDVRWSVLGRGLGLGRCTLAVLGAMALGGCGALECGAGTALSDGVCLPLEADPEGEAEPGWEMLLEETFEDGAENWELTTGNSYFRCGVEEVGGSSRYVQTLEYPQPQVSAYWCWMDLVGTIDLTGYDELRFTADYNVQQYDAGGADGLAVLNLQIEQDDLFFFKNLTWSNTAPADNGPQRGTMTADLSAMAWADEARITLRFDMHSCPDPTDLLCGATGGGLGHRIWMDNLRFEGR